MNVVMTWIKKEENNTEYSLEEEKNVLEFVRTNSIVTYFQPIISSKDGKTFGYEALTRIKNQGPDFNIGELFKQAIQAGKVSSLDMACRKNAVIQASLLGINKLNTNLFVNICPESLMDPEHPYNETDKLVEMWNIPKDRVVLEITEESAINNYDLFKKAVDYYRGRSYKIAIDDFGAGYGGLKMLSIIADVPLFFPP